MDRTKKLIVGLFVAGCLALFGVGLFLIGDSNQMFTKSFKVHADFSKITGIQNGGKVRVAGMDAGTVTYIDVPSQPDGKFRVHIRIVEKLHPIVRQDSVATIQTDGLLGNKYLQIDPGSTTSPPARADSLIQSKEPFDWGDLMDKVNSVVAQVNGIMTGVKEELAATLSQIGKVAKSATLLIDESSPDVKAMLASANRISANIGAIADGVEQGHGTVGKLFKDPDVYASVKRTVDKAEVVAENIREASASAKRVAAKVDHSEIVPEVQRTVKNLQQITAKVQDAVDKFQAASGEGGVGENLQRVLADAHEAMSDLSDDTEALKHNFFFRGFFNRRGFFDLGAITTPEYKNAAFGKGFKRFRLWLESEGLFRKDVAGLEVLSAGGKTRLDEAMTEILKFPRNGPLMVEGFTGTGSPSEQYLTGRRRAARVQVYLIDRFHLRPAYVGVVSMGAEPLANGIAGSFREGVGIVSFYK
jgi:phospholipid/cholesterol/gamma-HCH transport system substrate-binding protein